MNEIAVVFFSYFMITEEKNDFTKYILKYPPGTKTIVWIVFLLQVKCTIGSSKFVDIDIDAYH